MNKVPAIVIEDPDIYKDKLVLAIDDDNDLLLLIKKVLEKTGIRLITANNGEQGINMIRDGKPDLVLLDLIMPGLDGLSILRQLKADETIADVPIMIITAHSKKDFIMQAMKHGVQDYIIKPFNNERLKAKIMATLQYSSQWQRKKTNAQGLIVERKSGVTRVQFINLHVANINDQVKKAFSPTLMRLAARDTFILDIRNLDTFETLESKILMRIIEALKEYTKFLVAGKHYGAVVSETDLEDHIKTFITAGDLDQFIKTGMVE